MASGSDEALEAMEQASLGYPSWTRPAGQPSAADDPMRVGASLCDCLTNASGQSSNRAMLGDIDQLISALSDAIMNALVGALTDAILSQWSSEVARKDTADSGLSFDERTDLFKQFATGLDEQQWGRINQAFGAEYPDQLQTAHDRWSPAATVGGGADGPVSFDRSGGLGGLGGPGGLGGLGGLGRMVAESSTVVGKSAAGTADSGPLANRVGIAPVSRGLDRGDWQQFVAGAGAVRSAGGMQHLSVTDSEGRTALRQQYVPSSRGSDRVTMSADIPDSRSYRVTQSVFLEPGFEFVRGGKLGFGLGGGSVPSGGEVKSDGFSSRFMWRDGELVVYSYAADRPGRVGQDIPTGIKLPVGQWVELSMEVTTNSRAGAADGSLKAWVNGELAVDKGGMQWFTSGEPTVDTLLYSSFYGGSDPSWAPGRTTHMQVSDVSFEAV